MTPVNQTRVSRLATLAAAIVLFGSARSERTAVIEITPTVGFRWGARSGRRHDDPGSRRRPRGRALARPGRRHTREQPPADRASLDHQRTGLGSSTLFGPTEQQFDLDIDYYHVGALYQWKTKSVSPFIVGSIGIADLDPQDGFNSGTRRFSTSFGGGVKIPLSSHVAVRFEGRGFWTDTGDTRFDDDDDDDDSHHRCHDDDGCSSGLVQGQVRLGVTVSF
jgi:hypothetical protein